MTAASVYMTGEDLYVVACLAAGLGLIVVGVCWAADNWSTWRARNRRFVWLAEDLWAVWGWWAAAGHPGTVSSHRADPSPAPRRTR